MIIQINTTTGEISLVSQVLGCPMAMVLDLNETRLFVVMHSILRVVAIVLPDKESETSRAFGVGTLVPPGEGVWSPQGIALHPNGSGLLITMAKLSQSG